MRFFITLLMVCWMWNENLYAQIEEDSVPFFISETDTIPEVFPDSITIALWNKLVATGLQTPLWAKGNAYNAGHFYMLPIHAAFQKQQYEWQQQFAKHFKNFISTGIPDVEPTRLYRLQYYYLASWFLVLAAESGQDTLIPSGLFDIIYEDINNLWSNDQMPVWKWPNLPMKHFDNLRSRVLWKLYNVDLPEKTYHRAIIDVEKFTFTTAANLKYYLQLTNADTLPQNMVLDDILKIARIVFERRVEWNETGGWLFQPGFWTQHDDYLYAGNFTKDSPQPLPVDDISEDVSHSHRTALWLKSLALTSDEHDKEYYDSLRNGLDKQFFEIALLPPSDSINTYLTYNFMNGWNGLYRWNYHKDRPNTGNGPFELSGTMLIGWWTFLETERIKQLYKELSERFPIPDHILSIYRARSGETLNRNPDSWYENGWAELNGRLGAKL